MNVDKCISQLQLEISEKEKQIFLLKNLDLSEKVDEDKWHELCETPFRNSDDLGKLVLNIFPEAKDINVHCNYVYFTLYDFKVQIPTSAWQGINADTSWYHDGSEPTLYFYPDEKRMQQYFKCKDEKQGWKKCAEYRLGKQWKTWFLFLLWWGKYKWKNDNRAEWELRFKQFEDRYKEKLKLFYQRQKDMEEKVCLFVEKLLPELDNFSKKHSNYNGVCVATVKDIIDKYNSIADKSV